MARTTLIALLLAAGSAAGPAALAADAGGEIIAANCNGCHGFEGVSKGAIPSLKGRPAKLLEKAMMDFKSGARPATIMNRIAKGYSDQEIENMAEYYANLK